MNNCFYKITDDIAEGIKSYLKQLNYSQLIFLVDENTANYCLPIVSSRFNENFLVIDIKAGEEYKNLDTVSYIWEVLLNNEIDRNAILINLGGGTISDIGGFVASTYKRGIRFVNVPTTLMSQIDASIGGKTGVNFKGIKNVIGTIREPEAILVFPDFILTQDLRELKSGFSEMIKHALLKGGSLWERTREIRTFNINEVKLLIDKNIAVKFEFVSKDLYDKSIRHALNLGHTIGHAIESCRLIKGNKLLHGEAVAIGIVIESIIAKRIGMLPKNILHQIRDYIALFFELPKIENLNEIIYAIKNDKKNNKGKIRFTLLKNIGQFAIDVELNLHEVYDAIAEYNLLYKTI
jgi:3-dehydroquinate synthase